MGSKQSTPQWGVELIPTQSGRTILVTGANSGVGLQTAKHLAAAGAIVVMTSRDAKRGEDALKDVTWFAKEYQQHEGGAAHLETLDLCDFASVAALARRINNREGAFAGGLDAIVLNAGVMEIPTHTMSKDGFETQWQSNHLGHFKLVGEVLDTLRRSQKTPTVVPVSSILAHKGHLDGSTDFATSFKSGVPSGTYDAKQTYADSKQANLLFATELHRRHGSWLRVMPCHPGVSRTNLFRHNGYSMFGFMFQSADAGAALELRAVTDPSLPSNTYVGTGGGWKGTPIPETPAPASVDAAAAAGLWKASEVATGTSY